MLVQSEVVRDEAKVEVEVEFEVEILPSFEAASVARPDRRSSQAEGENRWLVFRQRKRRINTSLQGSGAQLSEVDGQRELVRSVVSCRLTGPRVSIWKVLQDTHSGQGILAVSSACGEAGAIQQKAHREEVVPAVQVDHEHKHRHKHNPNPLQSSGFIIGNRYRRIGLSALHFLHSWSSDLNGLSQPSTHQQKGPREAMMQTPRA